MLPVDRVEVTCAGCGTAVEKRVTEVARSKTGRHFCSSECRYISGVGLKPKTGAWVECASCGGSVYRERGQLHKERHFCDKVCYDTWQGRNKVARVCVVCNEGFELPPSRALLETAKYCSKACEGSGRIKRPLDREHNGKPAVVDNSGYVRIYQPDHPKATKGGWIFEHRWVVEQALGRYLDRAENVHHLNHKRSDNRPENLQLLSHSEHSTTTGRENGDALRAAIDARQKLAEYERRFGPLTEEKP